MNEIKKALKQLGITGNVTIKQHGLVVKVYVDGKKIGLWDTIKNNFVE